MSAYKTMKHITTMNRRAGLLIAALMFGAAPIWAQAPAMKPDAMPGMDHGQMDHSKMGHGNPPVPKEAAGYDAKKEPAAMEGMDHSKHTMGGATAGHWMAPEDAAKRRNPISADSASLARGKNLYQANCTSCHGAQGKGDGPAGRAFNPKPADLATMAGQHPDGDFAWKIANGRGPMPAWKSVLSETQIWDTVNFIQSLAPQAAKSGKTGEMEAMPGTDHSQMTHGDAAAGKTGDMSSMKRGDGGMDHGSMSMQGGSAPPDARDPHAYSGGYAFGPDRELRMGDEQYFYSILFDRLEAARTRDRTTGQYDLLARFGRDYDRAVLKAEGEVYDGRLEEARTELLWGHAVAAYWDMQLGVRYDSGAGPNRSWLAFGVQGLAPYWFEIDATAYVGDEGRTALRLEAEYELLLTQKLVLQPHMEVNLYGKRDAERGLGSGLSDLTAGVRLRYEIRREFAPYIGIERSNKYGGSADFARAGGQRTAESRIVAGVRFWF